MSIKEKSKDQINPNVKPVDILHLVAENVISAAEIMKQDDFDFDDLPDFADLFKVHAETLTSLHHVHILQKRTQNIIDGTVESNIIRGEE